MDKKELVITEHEDLTSRFEDRELRQIPAAAAILFSRDSIPERLFAREPQSMKEVDAWHNVSNETP